MRGSEPFALCGKFKITNTADDQVDRIPGDIPGTGLSEEEIEKSSNFHLKCHRINQNGNKKGLLKKSVYIIRLYAIDQVFMLFSPKLFSAKSLRSGLDTCFHTKFAFSGSRTWKQ